tara:strand:- start:914 stop:1513 length:600 start_codon:yes stop_codon:yes gene_type:complete
MKRNEIKFFYVNSMYHNIILKNNFKKQFNDRIVNSIYFDSSDYQDYHESIDGTVPRKKIRLRWYDNDFNLRSKNYVEIKKTLDNSKDKLVKTLSKEINYNNKLKNYFNSIYNYRKIVTVLVSYKRSYFADNFGNRVTIDRSLKYFKLNEDFKIIGKYSSKKNILELKINTDLDYSKFTNYYTGNIVRFSKYCNAVYKFL